MTLLDDYATKHTDKTNLAIHFLTVPLGLFSLLFGAGLADPRGAIALACVALVIQLYLSPKHALLFLPILAALATGAYYAAPLVSWKIGAPLAFVGFAAAVGAQGAGHRRESVQTKFSGPHAVLFSLVREQLVLSPVFLASIAR